MRTYLKLLVGPLLLGAILWRLDVRALLAAMSSFSFTSVATAAAISVFGSVIAALRWRVFVPEHGFTTLLRLSFIGQLYAVLLPGQLAGEAVKAYRLAKGQSGKSRLVASVVVDRVIGTVALLLLGVAGLWASARAFHVSLVVSFAAILAMTCLSLFALRMPRVGEIVHAGCRRLADKGPRCSRMAATIMEFGVVWRAHVGDRWRLAAALVLGLFYQGLAVAIFVVLGNDLDIRIHVADWLWIAAIVSLAVVIPLSIAGLGLRDGALVGALAYLDVAGERAIALSLALFALGVLGALIGWLAELTTAPESSSTARSGDDRS